MPGASTGQFSAMSYFRMSRELAWCYLIGLFFGNLLFFPLTGLLAVPTLIGSVALSLPLLAAALLLLFLFRAYIEAHLLAWCLAGPLVVTFLWIITEQFLFFNRQGLGFERYLWDPVAWARAALALTCASIASLKFYDRNRRGYSLSV
jgi:hypothetical protein